MSKSRAVIIRGVSGLTLNSVSAQPLEGTGKTTGETNMKNCNSTGSPLPTSEYNNPMGVTNNPSAVPVIINERTVTGNKNSPMLGVMPRTSNAKITTIIFITALNNVCQKPAITNDSRGKLILASISFAAVLCCSGGFNRIHEYGPENCASKNVNGVRNCSLLDCNDARFLHERPCCGIRKWEQERPYPT